MYSNYHLDFLPKPKYPTYPSYHQGYYLEEYFINYFCNNGIVTLTQFIPVSWTTCYNDGHNLQILQNYLNSLHPNFEYFVVCQHDDAPRMHRLPPKTKVFCAGGNYTGPNKIPIPLICSKLPEKYINKKQKDIFCSFVGSITHPIRSKILETYKTDPDFKIETGNWSSTIQEDQIVKFTDITSRSKYTLCPRGYGTTSFRLYEAMQLDTVPVYMSDTHDLPWSDELDWKQLCVIITPDQINDIKSILTNISDEQYASMKMKIKELYEEYFTLEGVCKNIIKRVQ
jgi:hypothetical protein